MTDLRSSRAWTTAWSVGAIGTATRRTLVSTTRASTSAGSSSTTCKPARARRAASVVAPTPAKACSWPRPTTPAKTKVGCSPSSTTRGVTRAISSCSTPRTSRARRWRPCGSRSGCRSDSTARGCRKALRNQSSTTHALLVAGRVIRADHHIVEVLVPGPLVVRAQRLVPRHAVQTQIRLSILGRMRLGPFQQLFAEPQTVPRSDKAVQIPGVGRVLRPDDRIFPLHNQAADDLALALGKPRLPAFYRRKHPFASESLRPLINPARPQPRRRAGEHVEHYVDFVRARRTNFHAATGGPWALRGCLGSSGGTNARLPRPSTSAHFSVVLRSWWWVQSRSSRSKIVVWVLAQSSRWSFSKKATLLQPSAAQVG